jgi:hypothetical protein
MGEQRMWMDYSKWWKWFNPPRRLKVGLRMLMVMRDGGVAFQAEQRWRSGQKRLEDGGVKGQWA